MKAFYEDLLQFKKKEEYRKVQFILKNCKKK